jgi:hypothetical protein
MKQKNDLSAKAFIHINLFGSFHNLTASDKLISIALRQFLNIYQNDESGPFKFEHDLNKMPSVRHGKWDKVPALTDVYSQFIKK